MGPAGERVGNGQGDTVSGEHEVPEQGAAASWLLQYTSSDPHAPAGDGRPWGDGTAMAARAYAGQSPWDHGCAVVPKIGGYATMIAIRDAFEAAIADAEAQAERGVPAGQRGHVYIADWLFNGLRDLSTDNPWGGKRWNPATTVARDQTALGFVVRMMSAGINVRMLLWMPTTTQRRELKNLADEHWSVAAAVQDHNNRLLPPSSAPLGVVALDLRTASPLTATLHQKMIVVRVGAVNRAFCGGVDLAFTRRDFGRQPTQLIGIGDWQSGETIPLPSRGWPRQWPPPTGGYPSFPYLDDGLFPEDLPAPVYGSGNRHWHDHHLALAGPIVATLEAQFGERWILDTEGRVYLFDRTSWIGDDDQVQLTSAHAFGGGRVRPLPTPAPAVPAGDATVQMWRTIPLRPDVARGPLLRGEFTVMAGVANAVAQATSLITIWDQYFWSEPLARLLAARLRAVPGLRLLIVLPPYGTTDPAKELQLRRRSLQRLWTELDPAARARVLVGDMWASAPNVGVYVHAKSQTYDEALLVCGSANMNRRSFECDAELDCAVLHTTSVRRHLSELYAAVTGVVWGDFTAGWLARWWTAIAANSRRALVPDPFFAASIVDPRTPNGVPMPSSSLEPDWLFEPTSIDPPVDTSVCQFPQCPGDPRAPGRLDEITFLLERCHDGRSWPWRVPNSSPFLGEAEPTAAMPRLTL
jgi:phosphatidylserine/phosphatidylglycerophosphate/cardiolipin synthase-like enzyme